MPEPTAADRERAERVAARYCLRSNPPELAGDIAAALAAVRAETREACAAKVEEQSRLLTSMFESRRHEAVCNDLAAAIRRGEAADA